MSSIARGQGPRRAAARRLLTENPSLPALLVAGAVLLAFAADQGGFFPTTWYPGGLVALALLGLWTALVPGATRLPRATAIALGCAVAFTCWAFLSITWASDQGAAWEGANRIAVYLALFALFTIWPVRPSSGVFLLSAFGLGVAAIGLIELVSATATQQTEQFFQGARFAEPVGYQNGNVGLFLMAVFPCAWVASSRAAPWPLRGVCLAAAGLLCSLALMGQSRGSLFALPVAVVVFVVLAPERLRALWAIAAPILALAPTAPPILDVLDAPASGLAASVDDAARSIVLMTLVLLLLGLLAAATEARAPLRPRARRWARLGTIVLVCAVALVGAGAAALNAGDLGRGADERWEAFKGGGESKQGSARFTSGGTNRYGFWVVAWDNFERSPLRGVGMDNFQQDYLASDSSYERPRFPHSLQLGVLSQTGLVGGLLLLVGLGAALAAAERARRRGGPLAAGVAVACMSSFAYWFLHGSLDWFVELPALAGAAAALLGLAGAMGPRTVSQPAVPTGQGRRLARAMPPVLAALAALSILFPWLSERDVQQAAATWPNSTRAAYARLERATFLNPLSSRAQLTRGAIALRTGDRGRAESAFRAALSRDPRNAHAALEAGALASLRGDWTEADRLVRLSGRLDPRGPGVVKALEEVAERRPVDVQALNRAVLKRAIPNAD